MNEQERKMLEEVVRLSRDNNAMVRKLVNANRRALMLRIIYWTIIIGSSVVAYYSILPYINSVANLLGNQNVVKVLDILRK